MCSRVWHAPLCRRRPPLHRRVGEAARPADVVILTSDNPREESAADIAAAIQQGLVGHPRARVELDRRAAIQTAIAEAAPADVVLIAGKGHETEQIIGKTKAHFSDVEEAKTALERR